MNETEAMRRLGADSDQSTLPPEYGSTPVPSITRQYDAAGEIDNRLGGSWLLIGPGEDPRAVFEEAFRAYWADYDAAHGTDSYARLRELIAMQLERLPDKDFVLNDAYFAGLRPMDSRTAGTLKWMAVAAEADRIERARIAGLIAEARRTGKRQPVTNRVVNSRANDGFDLVTTYVDGEGRYSTDRRFVG